MKAMLSLSARVPCQLGDVTATRRPTGALHGWKRIHAFIATATYPVTLVMFTCCGDPFEIKHLS